MGTEKLHVKVLKHRVAILLDEQITVTVCSQDSKEWGFTFYFETEKEEEHIR